MLINGKEVEVDFRNAQKIQTKINTVEQLPDSAKVEVNKKDLKELNYLTDNFNDAFNGFSTQNNILNFGNKIKERRKDYYSTFQDMSTCNFIQRGLQVISDDCTQRNQEGNVAKVYSDDDEIKGILDSLFFERLNINKELWSIVYETCKFGDNFFEVIPDSYEKPTMVARIRYLEPDRVNRIEKNGKLAFYTYMADAIDPEETAFQVNDKKEDQKVIYKLEPWQIIHFRITDKDFYPYGGSLLKSGVKTYKRLQLLEDGMVIYRLARVPERRVFKIDVGNLPTAEANRQVQKIADNYRTTQILDDQGNINRTASALALTQDMFVPVRDGAKGTEITTLGAGTALNNIDDIRYFRDQILWTMNIPPEYLGFTSDQSGGSQGRGSLAMQDIKFSRFIQRVQYYIEEGLTKIAAIELFFKHKKKSDLRNFRIELTQPSNIKETMDVEFLKAKMELIQGMTATQMFPKKFILKYVMKMTQKEINDLLRDFDIQSGIIPNDPNAQQGASMGISMGADMSGMQPDMNSAQNTTVDATSGEAVTQTSVATETVDTEKLVRLFGKDILIENKKDFAKLIKAAEEYNESVKKAKENKEVITEEENEESSDLVLLLSEALGNKNKIKTNESSMSLLYENELGGLDFDNNKFVTFESKKRTGPKGGAGGNIIFEEKSHIFKY